MPAATGLAGYVLAGRNERARDERAAKSEAIARRATVRERLEEQRHAFQRETLLELQDVLQRQVRVASRVIMHDRRTLKEHGKLTLLGDDLNQESYDIGVAVRGLQERVLNPGLRESLDRFRGHVAEVEGLFVILQDMDAEDAIAHLDKQQAGLARQYVVVSGWVGIAARDELEWLPDAGPGD